MNSYTSGDPLSVRLGSAIFPGNDAGRTFRVKRIQDGEFLSNERGSYVWEGTLHDWRRIGVIAGTKDKARFFVLEPSDSEDELIFEDFYVRGKFRISSHVNNTHQARDAWRAFTPE